ncbi:hypothetical protein T459_02594 [Capsicum annuum]|uniref:Peptidase S8/S53 domain-containing protein n=1 Tax=Capsicum annuum TaxID=4072 RepID=A0A2G3AKG8_CAPAN|nr:hypothetical protein T459_02594 [Capsicum annuum]
MMKGVLVSASAGNRVPHIGCLNNGSPWILCVASGHTDPTFAGTLTIGNGIKSRGWSLFPARVIVMDSADLQQNSIQLIRITHHSLHCTAERATSPCWSRNSRG